LAATRHWYFVLSYVSINISVLVAKRSDRVRFEKNIHWPRVIQLHKTLMSPYQIIADGWMSLLACMVDSSSSDNPMLT
jgi:hypothetical protein